MARLSFWQSLACALSGFGHAVRTQRNVRIQLGIAVLMVALAAVCQLTRHEWSLLVLAAGIVLGAELGNTAVEALVDLVSPQYHDLAKAAKDIAAAAVLVAAATAVVVGLLILGPPCYTRLFG